MLRPQTASSGKSEPSGKATHRLTRTDAELLLAARQDPTAFREFYDRYAVWMRAWLLRQTGSESAALDLTAETFAQAWHASRRFKDMADGSGAPWLFGIARNHLRVARRGKRRDAAELESLIGEDETIGSEARRRGGPAGGHPDGEGPR